MLDVRTDPDVPPIPPHATFEQAKDAAMALLKGDPNRWGVLKEGLMTKAREILPGQAAPPAEPRRFGSVLRRNHSRPSVGGGVGRAAVWPRPVR